MANTRTAPYPAGARIAGLLWTYAWDAATITYSFPTSAASYGGSYGDAAPDTFARLSAAQRAAVARALDEDAATLPVAARAFTVEGFTRLELAPGAAASSDLRIGNTSATVVPTAYAYYPSVVSEGGDVWFGGSGRTPVMGNYHNVTVLHELGHALGLKHTHLAEGGRPALPEAWDAIEFTVMSYRSTVGGDIGYRTETFGLPQTWMMLDIAALQELYGADYTANAGNTVYSWTPDSGRTLVNGAAAIAPGANRIFLTIWDGGGVDTYDLRAYATDLTINLSAGAVSRFSTAQTAILDQFSGERASGNVYNALLFRENQRSLIENAFGGSGDDAITGNVAANLLRGQAGDDRLFGRTANDRLYGEIGDDVLNGGAGDDRLSGGAGADVLGGGDGADVFLFGSAAWTRPGAADRIVSTEGVPAVQRVGVTGGDVIDLSAIDANVGLAGNQAFAFALGYSSAWLGQAGRLWAADSGADTVVRGTVNSVQGVDFEIVIVDGNVGAAAYRAVDFLL